MRSPLLRGIVAGLLAGLLAGVFAFFVAEPSVDAAIAIEEAAGSDHAGEAGAGGHDDSDAPGISRDVQKAGLILGTGLIGGAMGALFGAGSLWAATRYRGDDWSRACKLGAAFAAAVVILPAIVIPPNPPAVGDPDTVGGRGSFYVLTIVVGLTVAAAAWSMTAWLEQRGWTPHVAATFAAVGAGAVIGVFVALAPEQPSAGDFPADLLWEFRLSAIATQLIMVGVTAVVFGLLSVRATSREPSRVAAPAG